MYISAAQSLGNNEQFPIQQTQSLLWLMRPEWKCPARSPGAGTGTHSRTDGSAPAGAGHTPRCRDDP